MLQKTLQALPSSPGVYIFKNKKREVLYVGKAASLKSRVRSYFQGKLAFERPIEFVLDKVTSIETQQTESVIEAYFLEQELIKKHQPKYNVMGKDDKSFVYACVTKEDFPRFEIIRQTHLDPKNYQRIYGPFDAKHLVEKSLKILQKIFPYHNKKQKTERGCLDYQIGLCPGPYDNAITKRDYLKNIRAIEMIFRAKKKILIKKLEQEMKKLARGEKFEEATIKRNQIFALRHIQDVALLSRGGRSSAPTSEIRIEGYDISNISGAHQVASMVVFDNTVSNQIEPNKNQYRKFKIKTIKGANDVSAMKEVLERRFKNDWPLPNLIFLDGGQGHLNMATKLFKEINLKIPIMAVAKGPTRKKLDLRTKGRIPKPLKDETLITRVRDEAHRFAVGYHRKLRGKLS